MAPESRRISGSLPIKMRARARRAKPERNAPQKTNPLRMNFSSTPLQEGVSALPGDHFLCSLEQNLA